jgi:hypothetical protein
MIEAYYVCRDCEEVYPLLVERLAPTLIGGRTGPYFASHGPDRMCAGQVWDMLANQTISNKDEEE